MHECTQMNLKTRNHYAFVILKMHNHYAFAFQILEWIHTINYSCGSKYTMIMLWTPPLASIIKLLQNPNYSSMLMIVPSTLLMILVMLTTKNSHLQLFSMNKLYMS